MATSAPQMTPQQAAQMNLLQRQAVLSNALQMKQSIFAQSITPAQQTIVNVPIRPVGVVKGFYVEVTATLKNGAADAATRTGFGSANIIKNFTFTDLSSNQRINAPGWHIATINSARQGWVMGGAYAPNVAMGYGNNWNVNAGALTLAADAETTVRHIYWVPLAYSGNDLRGAIYAATTSGTMSLQMTINPTPFVGATDPVNAIYSGNANGGYKAGTTVDINVFQVWLDQLPAPNGQLILPTQDLATVYEIKQTSVTGMTVGQDFGYQFTNYREYLSAVAVFDNGGTFNSGSDVNYFGMQAANFTPIQTLPPEIVAFEARQTFMADPPPGVYYFNYRDQPVNTIAYGVIQLILNPKVVNANAQLLVGTEAFANTALLLSGVATSMPTG